MSTGTDIIVLSSSPDHIPTRTPAPPAYDPVKLFGLSPRSPSPPPPLSPTELFRPATRSRFFPVADKPPQTEKGEERTVKEITNLPKFNSALSEEKPKRRGRKPASEKSENASKTKAAPRKKRTENTTKRENTVNQILTGRVAKPGSTQLSTSGNKDTGVLNLETTPERKSTRGADWEHGGLQLEAAMKRRMDWTPPSKDSMHIVGLDEGGVQKEGHGFGDLLSEYGFNSEVSSCSNARVSGDDGPTKRRRIELVDPRLYPASKQASHDAEDKMSTEDEQQRPSKSKKPKAQTKKMNTITARVTARYLNELSENTDSSSKETSAPGEDSAIGKSQTVKRKSKAKPKAHEPDFVVLSPEAAAKSLENQDLIFGTCSQLEREDSPTTLREMQAAILESERCVATEPSSVITRDVRSTTTVSRFSKTRGLWSVASRDSEGSLVQQAEIIDLVDSPPTSKVPVAASNNRPKTSTKIDDRAPSLSQDQTFRTPTEDPPARRAPSPKPRKAAAKPSRASREPSSRPTGEQPTMPQYSGFTDTELSTQIAKYGFKAIKNRKKMIEMLQKCWESQHGKSMSTIPPVSQEKAPTSEPQIPSEKATRKTTTRKTTAKSKTSAPSKPKSQKNPPPATAVITPPRPSFIDVEEIQDSEEETIPSPSHYTFHPPTTKHLPISTTPSSPSRPRAKTSRSKTTTSPDLAEQITKAVRAQVPGTPSRPSWHEKIIMYDPIVLDDFAIWLNTEGLNLIGEDREVGAAFLRSWCESRGVCCCFRQSH
ncbi:hypothetical protein BDV25DRAFT_132928 [Aspergillus avenaceus]|uniref:Structure-specific endonuclease subunit SLX4 n=1 Tax=Aspergillus avenaceus TaxID=36643 RepID=A0A5N6TJJ3_ASPAV|nr:hypothetical protein BDV25DRAFT_132928 [Aspergillus avenaceus]